MRYLRNKTSVHSMSQHTNKHTRKQAWWHSTVLEKVLLLWVRTNGRCRNGFSTRNATDIRLTTRSFPRDRVIRCCIESQEISIQGRICQTIGRNECWRRWRRRRRWWSPQRDTSDKNPNQDSRSNITPWRNWEWSLHVSLSPCCLFNDNLLLLVVVVLVASSAGCWGTTREIETKDIMMSSRNKWCEKPTKFILLLL